MIYTSDDKFLHDSEFSEAISHPLTTVGRQRHQRKGTLGFCCSSSTLPGNGDGHSSARGGRSTATAERSEVSHHARSCTHTYTEHSWMCIYKQRRAHPQIIRTDTHESNSMRSLPAASSCLPRARKIIFPFHFPSDNRAEAAPLWLRP